MVYFSVIFRVEKEKEALKAELQRMKQQAAESKAYIEAQEAEERKLLKIISEADAERLRQKKELDQVHYVFCSDKTRYVIKFVWKYIFLIKKYRLSAFS